MIASESKSYSTRTITAITGSLSFKWNELYIQSSLKKKMKTRDLIKASRNCAKTIMRKRFKASPPNWLFYPVCVTGVYAAVEKQTGLEQG